MTIGSIITFFFLSLIAIMLIISSAARIKKMWLFHLTNSLRIFNLMLMASLWTKTDEASVNIIVICFIANILITGLFTDIGLVGTEGGYFFILNLFSGGKTGNSPFVYVFLAIFILFSLYSIIYAKKLNEKMGPVFYGNGVRLTFEQEVNELTALAGQKR